ncbi:MAG: HD domain-containing protein [Erysipelotrichaceae bacterium]|nr:HD domain-containing protein [Erysipelotrichaceae bacterium]
MVLKDLNNLKVDGKHDVNVLVTKVTVETARSGKEYVTLHLMDQTGETKAKYWEKDIIDDVKPGTVISATIDAKEYNGSMGFVVKGYKVLKDEKPENYKNTFIPDAEVMKNYLREKMTEIYRERPDLKTVLMRLFAETESDNFFNWAAAIGMHHAEEHGLLYHTVSMLKHAEKLADSAKETFGVDVDRHLVATAIILHDYFKIKEYRMNDAGRGEVTKFVILGHIQMASQFIGYLYYDKTISEELYLQLSHAVSAHHGELEFGSPVVPATIEAFIVHMADMFDSRMFMYVDEMRKLDEGTMSQNRNFGLGTNVYRPVKTQK